MHVQEIGYQNTPFSFGFCRSLLHAADSSQLNREHKAMSQTQTKLLNERKKIAAMWFTVFCRETTKQNSTSVTSTLSHTHLNH